MSSKIFSKSDLGKIKRAVMSAEAKSSVEIVPVFDQMSDEYNEASYIGAVYGSLLTVLSLLAYSFLNEWEYLGASYTLGIICLGFIWGALLPFLSLPIKRFLMSKKILQLRSRQRAYQHFLKYNVFNTKDRTGVLIHLSMFEHSINIIGDEGINKLVDQSIWDTMIKDISEHIQKGEKVVGIVNTIEKCGKILVDAGLGQHEEASNELEDDLRSD